MSRVVHFDLSADDPRRATAFYRDVFGWQIERWEGPSEYWLVRTGDAAHPGITGGIARRVGPGDSTAVVYDVASLEEAARAWSPSAARYASRGRSCEGSDIWWPAATPKATPSVCCSPIRQPLERNRKVFSP